MTEFLKETSKFILLKTHRANKIAEQVLINKRSREKAEKTRLNLKKTLQSGTDLASASRALWTAGARMLTSGSCS